MAVYKEEKTVIYRHTDWNGERKQTQKRGFKTKREAQAWEREQLSKATSDLDMTFKSFVELYTADMKTRVKENTWHTKEHIILTKLVPYFGKLKMCKITPQQIITWQNELMNYKDEHGKPYSPVYLKTVHNQLSAIFNHAVCYYNLRENPCQKAGSMGKKKKPGDALLDEGGVPEICGGDDGQALVLLCLRNAVLVWTSGRRAAGFDPSGLRLRERDSQH